MGEVGLLEVFVSLGVPGLALGVFYMLYRRFNWDFPKVPTVWVGPIIVLFMLLTFAITYIALSNFTPPEPKTIKDNAEVENTISLALFQFMEGTYLSEAESGIVNTSSSDRLKLILSIMRSALVGPQADDIEGLVDRFVDRYPNDPWRKQLRAVFHYQKGKYRQCAQELLDYSHVAQNPGRPAALFFRGVCQVRDARQLDGAERLMLLQHASESFQMASEAAKKSQNTRYRKLSYYSSEYFIGITKFYSGQLDEARTTFKAVANDAEAPPKMKARALNGMGFISFIKGDLQGAEVVLLASLKQYGEFAYARSNFGYVLLGLDKFAEAIDVFRAMVADENLKATSPRDVVLARISLAYAESVQAHDELSVVTPYSQVLKELGYRDFIGVAPLQLRYALLCDELAKKVYLDRSYYGLEVFAAAYLAKAYLAVSSLPTDVRGHVGDELFDNAGAELASLLNALNGPWLDSNSSLFGSIGKARAQIAQINALKAGASP